MTDRKLRYLGIAEAELDDVVAWYEAKRAGLGGELVAEVKKARVNIETDPYGW
jgi:hypothetical protein